MLLFTYNINIGITSLLLWVFKNIYWNLNGFTCMTYFMSHLMTFYYFALEQPIQLLLYLQWYLMYCHQHTLLDHIGQYINIFIHKYIAKKRTKIGALWNSFSQWHPWMFYILDLHPLVSFTYITGQKFIDILYSNHIHKF